MFPATPWKDISNDGKSKIFNHIYSLIIYIYKFIFIIALSFLQTLLELDSKKRLLINKVFLQPWLQVEH